MVARLNRLIAGSAAALALVTQLPAPSFAYVHYHHYYYARPTTRVYVRRARFGQVHPVLKRALIGGAVGAGAGLIGGAIAGHHRAGRGALIGLGTGAGVGALSGMHQLRYHPIIRNTAEGSLIGLGVGSIIHRHGSGWKGAGIGGLLGAGYGLLRHRGFGYY